MLIMLYVQMYINALRHSNIEELYCDVTSQTARRINARDRR